MAVLRQWRWLVLESDWIGWKEQTFL